MSKSGNTTTAQTQTNPLALGAYSNAVNTGTSVAQQPYPVYNSPLVAGFTPTQQSAFSDINSAAGLAQPYIGQAADLIQQSTSGIDPTSTVDKYMSPYTSNVVQGLENVQNQQNAQQQEQLAGQAAAAGAFGGDRSQIAQSVLAGQQALGENPAIANALQSGYSQALSTGLSAQEANAWLASQGAFGLANLGQESQGEALSGANAKLQSGSLQQQLKQEQLTAPYQQFQAAQQFPYTISNFEMGLASGAGGAGGTSSTTAPPPSLVSQGVGLGTLGLGAYKAYQNSGSGGTYGNYSGGPSKASTGATGWYTSPSSTGGRIPSEDRALGGYVGDYGSSGLGAGSATGAPIGLGTQPAQPGGLSPQAQAGLGAGNPMTAGSVQQLQQMPTEKLREMATRVPPQSQQAALIQAMLHRRQMNPQSDPGMQSAPQGLGAMPGMAAGGDPNDAYAAMLPEASGTPEFDPDLDPTPLRRIINWAAGLHAPPQAALPGGFAYTPPADVRPESERHPDMSMAGLGEGSSERSVFRSDAPNAVDEVASPVGLGDAPMIEPLGHEGQGLGFAGPVGVAPTAGLAGTQVARTQPHGAGFGAARPYTAAPPSAAPPSAGLGEASPDQEASPGPMPGLGAPSSHPGNIEPSFLDRLTTGSSGALVAAGLGMLSGSSPFASVNIGQGGKAGLEFAEQQRQRQAQMQYNMLKQQELDDYRKQMAKNAANRTDIYGQRVQAMTALDQAKSARLMAQAAMQGASKVTDAQLNEKAINDLVGTQKPDGTTWTRPEATRYMHFSDIKQQTADASIARVDQGQQRIDNQVAQFQQTEDYHQQLAALHQKGLDFNAAKTVLDNATRRVAADFTGKTSMEKALHDAQEGLNAARAGTRTAPASPAIGTVQQGYRFLGGDPAQQSSWTPAP